MATQTENLGLTKPDAAEGYDINVFNNNADTLDQFAGEMRNMLGGTGGGLGDKVDALQANVTAARSEIAAVKTDTAALVQALATANANIATLLTQTGGVKAIISGTHKFENRDWSTTIPDTMNPDKVVIITSSGMSDAQSTTNGVVWTKAGSTVKFTAYVGHQVAYQFVEFY